MGTESDRTGNVTLYTLNGERIEKIQDLPEITPVAEEEAPLIGAWEVELQGTFQVKQIRIRKCTGRKRFIKLMMGERICRNNAVWLANLARSLKVTYSEAWNVYLFNKWKVREDDTAAG